MVDVEWEEEFDGGAGEEGCHYGVHCAVNVVEGENVEEVVLGRV